MDESNLVFEESVGLNPAPDTLEEKLLHACGTEDKKLWRELCLVPRPELERAVTNLRKLGWRFYLVTVH